LTRRREDSKNAKRFRESRNTFAFFVWRKIGLNGKTPGTPGSEGREKCIVFLAIFLGALGVLAFTFEVLLEVLL
jgi:hypothetical protein